ncbi:LacI family DNA-binding transcriptional regulator [Paractinoplanes lichenicola]|uniref:LacI family DNA-binding transcriptional regulator n=1 Tax=Paractinoplanes lichenicola TaxID=2802976 RepID=A0ABS1VSW7_9ACTN|nr:LacI family DNA-binding transcriptional regulator [Actinoplanes lichenicola]MBL7257559.1 LacI family DNA-binding transcriptional regulator [Actinoplanes lichenicola]
MMDVARLAGVSHQTVSRVLNEHKNVSEQTRLKVRAAIAELGYRPNRTARALVTGTSKVIGVVAPNTALYGPSSMLTAFEQAAQESGFAVNVGSVRSLNERSIADAVERHLDQRVAGLVVIAPVASAGPALARLPEDVPLVTIDGDPQRASTLVTVDQVAGARAATEHLLAAGHSTVWHISGPADWFDAAGRVQGWEEALKAAGAEQPPLLTGDWSAESGYRNGKLLARLPEVTAVFTANDHIALGLLRALSEHGRRVPEEISIVGFDDVPQSAYYTPPLTTVRPDFDAVATASVELLLEQIDSGTPDASTRRTIAPTLIPRDSVAPPPPR